MSEEQIVDCCHAGGSNGCSGGEPAAAMGWIVQNNHGSLDTEQSYPYTAGGGRASDAWRHDVAEELSLLMRVRADHFDALFDFAGAGDTHANDHAARVGVLTSWRNNAVLQPANASGAGKLQVRPPAKSLRALGVDYRFETAKTIGLGSLSGEHTSLEMLLCEDDVSLDADTAAAIGVWVRGGGSQPTKESAGLATPAPNTKSIATTTRRWLLRRCFCATVECGTSSIWT